MIVHGSSLVTNSKFYAIVYEMMEKLYVQFYPHTMSVTLIFGHPVYFFHIFKHFYIFIYIRFYIIFYMLIYMIAEKEAVIL